MAAHPNAGELDAGLDEITRAPKDVGTVELVVRRPGEGERESIEEGTLDRRQGLVGDDWSARAGRSAADGVADPNTQLTLMSSRAIALVAGDRARWALAGDQLYVDLDLSVENLPPGTRLEVGSAVIVVTEKPHTGCAKFTRRFGPAAIRFVSSPLGRALRLRGMYARVERPGAVRPGDTIRKLA